MTNLQKAKGGIADIFRRTSGAKSGGGQRPGPPATLESTVRLGKALSFRRKPKHHPSPSAPCFFLTVLPIELREMVYLELMRPFGDKLHIFERNGRFLNAPCISNHEVDDRQDIIEKMRPRGVRDSKYYNAPIWSRRLASAWSNHWRCEEKIHGEVALINRILFSRSILPMLLTCKSIYFEFMYILAMKMRFTFTSLTTAYNFFALRQPSITHNLKTLHFSFRENLSEFKWDLQADGKTRWRGLWDALAQLDNIREIKLWLDGDDENTRFYLTEYHDILRDINEDIAKKLTISLPYAEGDLDRWEPVVENGEVVDPGFKPLFRYQTRGWPRYYEASETHIYRTEGRPVYPRFIRDGERVRFGVSQP